jgi:putative ATP-binding cassette transporter
MLTMFSELQKYLDADDRRQWIILLVMSLGAGLAQSLTLAVFNEAVAAYGRGEANGWYLPLVATLAAIGFGAGYFGALRGHVVSTRMAIQLRDRLLDQIGGGNLRVVERIGGSALHYHLMTTITNLAGAYGTLLAFATSLVMLTCNFIYVGWLSPVGLLAAILITVVGVLVHFRQERLNVDRKWLLEQLTNTHHRRHREVIDGYKELRLSDAKLEDYRGRIDALNQDMLVKGLDATRTTSAGDLATYFFQFLMIVMVVFMLPLVVRLDAVVIMQLMTAILVTMGPLSGVVGAIPGFTRARIALRNLRVLQQEVEATRETAGAATRRLPEFESIELRGVEFAFDDDATGEAFHLGPLDLTVRRGEIVFIVGGNGSGKTVLMRVLTALYHPSAGTLRYNGEPLADADRQAYREQFSTVFSDFYLFRELLGLESVDAAKIDEWLARFDLADKTRFENGEFSTLALSAGQRKRLAFAVAMLEDRPIYVLDEFGAEQDPEHRRRFYREMLPDLRASGKTVVVVTHDDAYFDAADRVLRMDFGKIVGEHPSAAGIMQPKPPAPPEPTHAVVEENHTVQEAARIRRA